MGASESSFDFCFNAGVLSQCSRLTALPGHGHRCVVIRHGVDVDKSIGLALNSLALLRVIVGAIGDCKDWDKEKEEQG